MSSNMSSNKRICFAWKRKLGDAINNSTIDRFEKDSISEDNVEDLEEKGIDWLTLRPKKCALVLEDAISKVSRLQHEGATLAESSRFWEAIKKWNDALELIPTNTDILEMKSQAYLAVGEIMCAINSIEKVTKLRPNWYVAWQTLGRCQLNLGEVSMAVRSFCKALHLKPDCDDLRNDDLIGATKLLKQYKEKLAIQAALKAEQRLFNIPSNSDDDEQLNKVLKETEEYFQSYSDPIDNDDNVKKEETHQELTFPDKNYVIIRH